jgi:hypothetical protein
MNLIQLSSPQDGDPIILKRWDSKVRSGPEILACYLDKERPAFETQSKEDVGCRCRAINA